MARPEHRMTVERTEQVSPHLVRVWFSGPGVAQIAENEDSDRYVKLIFAPEGVTWPESSSVAEIQESAPPEEQPILRTYSIRRLDADAQQVAIEFVVHGDEGVAGPWAAGAQPGESMRFFGPGSGYRPDPAADWHLLVGDEAALPAVAAALEAMPADAVARVYLEVAGPEDEVALEAPAGAQVRWVHRGGASHEVPEELTGAGSPLVAAVREGEWLDGDVQVFVHGEAEAVMKNIRPYVRKERGVPAARAASISGYWRRGRTEEGFRRWKADLRAAEEGQPA